MSTRLSLLLASGLTLAAPAAFADTAQPTAIEHVTTAQPAAQTSTPTATDASRYAAREKQDKQVQDYKGGSVLVVGVSGGAVLVLLILLILLV